MIIPSLSQRTVQQDAEMMRLQLLGDPNLMRQVQQVPIHFPYFTFFEG